MQDEIHQKEPAMNPEITLFTQVRSYYRDLVDQLATAQDTISMTYLAFDIGEWAGRIAQILGEKAARGVYVRLMVDEIGEIADEPRHILRNRALLSNMKAAGVQIDIFRPSGHGLTPFNRLHCKICAIDQRIAYLGGSNIGDYYTGWSDTNLRLNGELGNTFHGIYDYLCQFSAKRAPADLLPIDPSNLWVGCCRIWLTVPGQRSDIRRALLDLIEKADQAIHIRTWYFLPDPEILQALCVKAKQGVKVDVLLSHQTRVRPVDIANYLHAHQLALCGVRVHRYTGQYMHAKLAWNNQNDVLLGSANLDSRSMTGNFEICLAVRDACLAQNLEQAFVADLNACFTQTPEIYRSRSLPQKIMSHTCNLASAWL
jgi:cardiolipin synthase